jgi:hypothetical protein
VGSIKIVIDQAARRIGKPLFVGEFGDPGAPDAGPGSFTERMLDRIVGLVRNPG